MTLVIKKDGRKTPFYIEKIESNLDSAERVFGISFKEDKKTIISRINKDVSEYDEIKSSEVFNIIEKHLEGEPLVLIAFKEFKRKEQEVINKATDIDYQTKRLDRKDKDVLNENGNKDSRTAMTQRDLLSGSLIKAKSLMMYPEDVRRAHLKGILHLHE